ncbi:hypothetical protein [Luteimonas granuli]|uniref:Uncharacterized protein n=1 Tax=Luteimonas granuli TaxID=1176533 RepID=A0A518N0Q3_9GAMM|nr:hypothetical protein [Luteimonas granuli]QDW65500.1 hypothetical protein FPZ22_00025 [Luteimonas granuli]
MLRRAVPAEPPPAEPPRWLPSPRPRPGARRLHDTGGNEIILTTGEFDLAARPARRLNEAQPHEPMNSPYARSFAF